MRRVLLLNVTYEPLTTVALTPGGRAALERYTAVLRQLLDAAEPAPQR